MIDKDLVKKWKFIGKNAKIYDNELKSYIHILNVGALSKMQIPINEKSSLNLMHGFITFQIYLNTTKSFTIEIAISDSNNGKKRILLSACSKEFIINQLHCRIPMINIPTGIWINFSIDILSFVSECFKGQSFRAIDSICLSADCKIRRICGMRQLYTDSVDEYLQGDESALPKGFILSKDIRSININFNLDYIKQTVDIKNIKNNNLNKDKKIYPKTSQSKREGKLSNTTHLNYNNGNENQKINNDMKVIRNDKKSKSINKQILKTNFDNDIKYRNNNNLKENTKINSGSSKNLKIVLNKVDTLKKLPKNNNKLIITSKKEEKTKNIFSNKKKSKEKFNSKSVGKVFIKTKENNYINEKENNNKNEKILKDSKNKSQLNKNKKIENNNIKIKNTLMQKKDEKINNNINIKQSQIIEKNQVIINNNKINNIISKEEIKLFNTFNYKDLESKENTLLINQSNFNNASIPEIVDLDINNTYLKNNENDINCNNDIILIDNKNKKEENIINIEQMDSLYAEKILSDINDNKNERPFTPPLERIVPVNNENNSLNNINISKINESLIQNHYYDLVYDKETGRYFDKKTNIFYDLNK